MSFLHHLLFPRGSNNQRARLLHPTGVFSVIILLLLFQVFLGRAAVHYPNILGYASQISPAEIIRLTNKERVSNNLPPVKLDSQLSAAAAQKAGDMFARDYWAHVSPIGTQPWTFITNSGYSYRYAGENLARDFSDPVSVVAAWMNSPSHRENLLNSHYQDIGVAVVDGRLSGKDTTLVVQLFGTRLSAAPSVTSDTSFTVKAAQDTKPAPVLVILPTAAPVVTPAPAAQPSSVVSPFSLTKGISLSILLLFAVILAVDLFMTNRQHIVRWTSKSFAHFIFIAVLLIAAAAVLRGQLV